jgi:DMSO/TMAO reductase YedYZ heme-binding membrane subunit
MPTALIVAIIVAVIVLLGAVIWTSWSYQLKPDSRVKEWHYVAAMAVPIVGFVALAVAYAVDGSVGGPVIFGFAALALGAQVYTVVRRHANRTRQTDG